MTVARAAAPDIAAELVHRLFVLLKAAAVYGPDNEGYRSHSATARAALDEILAKDAAVRLDMREDRLYFNGLPIRFFLGDAGSRFMIGEMKRMGVGSLEFRAKSGTSQLDVFVFAFNKARACRERAFDELQKLLRLGGVTAISAYLPELPEEGAGSAGTLDAAGAARRAFLQAVNVVEDLMSRVRAGRDVDFAEPKRVVEGLAEQVIADAQTLFELSMLQNFDEYTCAHCVNVCVYSIAIGDSLGLSRERLSELGFGALFHDIGKAKLPRELIDKPDAFGERDWELIRLHPALGVKSLLALNRPLDGLLSRAISIAFEHHLGLKGQGYPKLPRPRRQDLFSRICAVADAFDAMTSGRVYSKRAMSPHEALRRMIQGAGTAFDPLLLRLFINAVGIFPIGTALLLDSGEQVVVTRNDSSDLLRPQVAVHSGRADEKAVPQLLDLARLRTDSGERRRSIRSVLDPKKAGIDVTAILRARAATAPAPAPPASGPPAPPLP